MDFCGLTNARDGQPLYFFRSVGIGEGLDGHRGGKEQFGSNYVVDRAAVRHRLQLLVGQRKPPFAFRADIIHIIGVHVEFFTVANRDRVGILPDREDRVACGGIVSF